MMDNYIKKNFRGLTLLLRLISKVNFKSSIALLCCLLVYASALASSAFTGMRNITSLELTADMGVGWNLGNTLDATPDGETSWGNPLTTKAMIDEIRKRGFKTIRIPTTWYSHLGAAPDYIIDPAWLDRVEAVANYAFDNDMYVIINTHHEEGEWLIPTYVKQAAVTDQITKVWTQIANRFKDYGDYLIFETMNEPRLKGSAEEWSGGTVEGRDVVNKYNLAAVNAIRNTGGNNALRHIMIPTYAANGSDITINALVVPNNDSRVIISIHNYSPYSFCQQLPGTTSWGTAADKASLDAEFDKVYNKFVKNGRAVVIGEWGSIDKTNTSARTNHAIYLVKSTARRKMPAVWWDNGDLQTNGFAIFNRNTLVWKYPQIADAIVASSIVTGVSTNIELHAAMIYPNPVQDKLKITLPFALPAQVRLYTVEGYQVLSVNVNTAQVELDMSGFRSGMYVLKFISASGVETKKIAKE